MQGDQMWVMLGRVDRTIIDQKEKLETDSEWKSELYGIRDTIVQGVKAWEPIRASEAQSTLIETKI